MTRPLVPDRRCPHGVKVGPLDDYGVPENEEVKSVYCWICNGEEGPSPTYPEPKERPEA